MASVEERIKKLAAENFDTQGRSFDLDADWSDAGASSSEIITLLILINKEFNITILPDDYAKFSSMRDLIKHIEANAS